MLETGVDNKKKRTERTTTAEQHFPFFISCVSARNSGEQNRIRKDERKKRTSSMLTEINFEHLEAMPAIILCVEKAVSSYIDRLYREVITWAPEHLSYHSSIETSLFVRRR